MKIYLSLFLLLVTCAMSAQFDNPRSNSVQFEQVDTAVPQPTGLEIPASRVPGLSNKEYRFDANMDKNPLGKDDPQPLDITATDGFLSTKTDTAPKAFQKDKPASDKYDRDQALGQINTGSSQVNVVYRDHQSVDGDRIRVYVNDDIVQSDITLDGSFRGFDLALQPGENVIEFQALNQGDSGPNTAELHVYDDKGQLISKNEWNLLTGRKATIVVYKD